MGTSEAALAWPARFGLGARAAGWEPVRRFGLWFAVVVSLVLAACAGPGATVGASSASPALTAPDAGTVTLAELSAQADATVLVFWSAGCPCVRRYQARVDALLERYPAERVRVLAVASNAGESFEEARRVALERGVRVPLYRDPGGAVAELVGARSTPTAAVLDRTGRVRFLGWIDNEREPGTEGREPWLENAVDGLLNERSFSPRTPTWGCTITRSLFSPEPKSCSAEH